MEIEEKVWTVKEVSKRLKRCVGTIRRMITRGELRAIRPGVKGGKISIPESSIKEFIAGVEK